MNEELLAILRSARRKLLLTRALESATALIAFSAAFAAAGLLALRALAWFPQVGVIPFGILILLFNFMSWMVLDRRGCLDGKLSLLWIFLCFLASFAVMGLTMPFNEGFPKIVTPAAGILLSAGVGAGAALARGAGLREVAAMLDAKAGLRERLSTAAELALSASAENLPPSAPVVYAQALAALKEKRPQKLPMWSASPGLPAGAALALTACLAMAFLPDFGKAPSAGTIEKFSQSVPAMTPAQRAELARAFRQAATQPTAAGDLSQELVKAAAVVEVSGAQELQQILQKLQAAGYAPLQAVPPNLLAAAGIEPTPSTMAVETPSPTRAGPLLDANLAGNPGGGYVSVYDPRYAGRAHAGPEDANAFAGAPRAAVPYADAWAAARARAADDAARGTVPPQYRRLVQDYFAGEER